MLPLTSFLLSFSRKGGRTTSGPPNHHSLAPSHSLFRASSAGKVTFPVCLLASYDEISGQGASSQDTKTFDAALSEELHAALSEWLTAIRAWFREVPSSQASSENTRSGGATRTSEHRVALSEWLRPTTVLDLVELGRRSGEWEGSGY